MYGGSGADRFIYKTRQESFFDHADIIHDFSRAEGDKIQLAGLGFTGIAAGTASGKVLGYTYNPDSNLTLVRAADSSFGFELVGKINLIASDFQF